MDNFLDTYEHENLNQEDINHLNRSVKHNEIEAVIKSPSKKKSPEPKGVSAEFYQTFKKELIPTLLKLFHKIEREKHCLTYFMKPVLHSFQNCTNTHSKKRTRGHLFNEYRCKILNKIMAN
jgi:hypothetical protein